MVNINRMLTGRTEPQAFLVHQSEEDSRHGNSFGTPRELEQHLLELQRNNQLPAILSVHERAMPQAEPANVEARRRAPSAGQDVQGADRGPGRDVSINELFRATREPMQMDLLN